MNKWVKIMTLTLSFPTSILICVWISSHLVKTGVLSPNQGVLFFLVYTVAALFSIVYKSI